jgi:hypothetical protein
MVRYTDAPDRSVATIVSPKVWTMMCHNFTALAWVPMIPLFILSRECIEVANGYQTMSEATPCSLSGCDGLCFEWSLIIVSLLLAHWYAIYEPCC